MIFIGGIDSKSIELDALKPTMCKHCRESHEMKVIKQFQLFHFFFIPIKKWNMKYYAVCDGCEAVALINPEKGRALEQGEQAELTLWDLEVISEGQKLKQKCLNCHQSVDRNYEFCPHCGEKKIR